MKKIKTALASKTFLIILISITILYITIIPRLINNKNQDITSIEGIIRDYKKNDKKIEITIGNTLIVYYTKNKIENINYGDKIKVLGYSKEIPVNTNFNLFNYKNYLKSKKINNQFIAENIISISKTKNPLYIIKNLIYKKINQIKRSKAYLFTFICGNKDYLDKSILSSYQTNGVSHLFVISGMHVALIVIILFKFLNKTTLSAKKKYYITFILLLFYLFLTDFSISTARAVFFFILLGLNKMFYINIKKDSLLIITMCLFLLYNPYLIYNLGFLLSFIITFYIISFSKNIETELYFKNILKISIISFLASFPIIIYNFFEINFLSLLINIIFFPIITIIIFPFSFLVFLFPKLDSIYYFFIKIIEELSLFLNNISIFKMIFKKPSLIIVIFYYVLIYFLLKHITKKKIIIFSMIILIHYNINYFDPSSSITMIDVEEGDSIFIKLSHNQGNILIDTGGKQIENYSSYNVVPYLKSQGIKTIDYLVLTHGDNDHLGETKNIINNFKIKNVYINNNEINKKEQEIINLLKKENILYKKIDKKEIFINNSYFHLISYKSNNENDSSIITYGNIKNNKILLLGDISKDIETKYLNQYQIEKLTLLKIAHHGSDTSTSNNLIEKTNPQIAFISCGKKNIYGHPSEKVIFRLQKNNIKVFSTKTNGAVKYNLRAHTIKTVLP